MAIDTGLETVLGTGSFELLKHYNDEVEIRYDAALHVYYVEGEDGIKYLVPGVTSVLACLDKPALVQWAANETVNYIVSHFPAEEARTQLVEFYTQQKNKLPIDILQEPIAAMVTTDILSKLFNEARFNFRTISKDAKDIGHIAHEWLEVYLKMLIENPTNPFDMPPLPEDAKAANCVDAAHSWMTKHNFKPFASEKKIYSRKYCYSGTYDWTALITGCGDPACCPFSGEKKVIGDFKSSKHIYDEYRIQLAAYWKAHEEEFPDEPLDGAIVMRLDKEGDGVETLTILPEEIDKDFDAFLGAMEVYNWMQQFSLDKKYNKAAAKMAKAASKPPKKAPRKAVIKQFEPIPIAV